MLWLPLRRMNYTLVAIVLAAGGTVVAAPIVQAQRFGAPPPVNQEVRYRFIGPDGNRAVAAIGEPGNPNVMFVGAASGGIWRTEDAGLSWQSVFDKYDVQSIGALAMAPSAAQHRLGRNRRDVSHASRACDGERHLSLR